MIRNTILIAMVCVLSSIACGAEVQLTTVGEGFARTSINAVIFRRYSLFTHDGTQYIAYYGGDGTMMLGKRKTGDAKWTTHATQYKGHTGDAHNSISLAVDGDGYLHVTFDHHGVPLNYAKSVEPGSLDLTDKLPMVGDTETNVTYPEFYPQADGGLLFLYRDGASGNGNLVLNRYDLKSKKWSHVYSNLIDGEKKRNAYWQAASDASGTLHLSWVWRETGDVATNHDVCYAKSSDGGRTWTKSDGTVYELPIKQATAEVALKIPQKSDLINQTSMFADVDGHPYIATYFRPQGAAAPQFHLIYNDGKAWHSSQVLTRTLDFHLAGGGTKRIPISRPLVLADTSNGVTRAYLVFRDAERKNLVSIASCDDLSKQQWSVKDLTDFSVGQWEPTCDPTAWRDQKKINLFIQNVGQGDGEKQEDLPPQPVQVLEYGP
jgi:hypothetical protein